MYHQWKVWVCLLCAISGQSPCLWQPQITHLCLFVYCVYLHVSISIWLLGIINIIVMLTVWCCVFQKTNNMSNWPGWFNIPFTLLYFSDVFFFFCLYIFACTSSTRVFHAQPITKLFLPFCCAIQIMASSGLILPEKQLQCSICQRVLTDPVTTPCGHNFCQSCIENVWDSSDVCRCPSCDRSFERRPEISINTAFKELADTFRKMTACSSALPLHTARPGEVVCDVCATASLQVRAQKSCLVCLTSYCDAHLEPHQRVAALKLHKLIDPVKNLQDRMCKKHERLLEMFCRDEQKCVCRFCIETEHKDHQAVTIEAESLERKVKPLPRSASLHVYFQGKSLDNHSYLHKHIKLNTPTTDASTSMTILWIISSFDPTTSHTSHRHKHTRPMKLVPVLISYMHLI